jgi:2-amino-4-hydroxy-6-hydroxymethyldihydropteridine diphosphokinase
VVRVAIALGSNLGDRQRHLSGAAAHLSEYVSGLRLSAFHDTAPVGVGLQPRFLNAAAVGECALPPRDLLESLLTVERTFGRERPYAGAPRTLDLDLILYGDAIINEPGLVVPHPRFRERRFVLAPLAELAAEWVDPVTRLTVATLLDQLS